MTSNKWDEVAEIIARKAVDALIQDAKVDFKCKQQGSFVFAIYNAVRYSNPSQLENLRDLLLKRGIEIQPGQKAEGAWVN
jgi:hypothetical protein